MTPNDKLPEDVRARIVADATQWSEAQYGHDDVNKDYLEGALHEAKIAHALKAVLQEFVSNHEAGLLPNRFVYEKAIKILNDGKKEPTRPCPHCGKELYRDRNLCCRECGTEVGDTCRCILPNYNAFTGKCLTCGKE